MPDGATAFKLFRTFDRGFLCGIDSLSSDVCNSRSYQVAGAHGSGMVAACLLSGPRPLWLK